MISTGIAHHKFNYSSILKLITKRCQDKHSSVINMELDQVIGKPSGVTGDTYMFVHDELIRCMEVLLNVHNVRPLSKVTNNSSQKGHH